MKILVVYYSKTGNNEKIAIELANKLNADIERISDRIDRPTATGVINSVMAGLMKLKTPIKPPCKHPKDYDLVVLTSPVRIGHIVPPVRTYLWKFKDDFKKIAYVSACLSNTNPKAVKEIESITKQKVLDILEIKVEPANPENLNKPENFGFPVFDEKDIENKVIQSDLNGFSKKLLRHR